MKVQMDKGRHNSIIRIAMIGHKRIPSREGGIEVVVEELSKRLAEKGYEVHVYNRKAYPLSEREKNRINDRSPDLCGYKGLRLISIPTFQARILNAFVYSLLGTIKALTGNYDAIHYHAEGPCAMLWLPHLFGIRTVATIHGLDWMRAKWSGFSVKYIKFGEKVAAKYADEIIVLSKNLQQYFMDTYRRKVNFIPNGINRPVPKGNEIILKKWGLKKDGYLLYLARIVPEKGVHYLLEAYRDIATLKKLVIAGDSSHTEEYLKEIKRKAQADDRVIFTGFLQGEELEEIYSNAYLYILPSDLEGMPISLLEAMSYGNCCVVSDIPECLEVVENRAVTFHKGDVSDLRKKLSMLLRHPEIAERYKAEASDFICGKYDWDNVVKNTVRLYEEHEGEQHA